MSKAQYKLDFEIKNNFDVKQTMKIELAENGHIIFQKSDKVNSASIFFDAEEPNSSLAKIKGQKKVE